ncbi:MAG: cytochrome c biogenesis protein CcdA [Syntrophobacterales bacterium]|nr:cytochrome c biogenesis protein CcdA [Syntrophobacterales bacterium]
MGFNISIGLAFLAGLASFLSPCLFSLVPAYIGYLGGRAAGGENRSGNRFTTFTHGLAFVLGFSVVFVLLGVAASAFGSLLYDLRNWVARIGGIVVILFGLHMTGVFRIAFLEYDVRIQGNPDRKRGYITSFLMGIFFSAGWSPCIGPVLGSILTLAVKGSSVALGTKLLISYSLGLAIPFLIAALSIGWLSGIIRRYGKMAHYVEVGMGVVLVIVGLMLLFNVFQWISNYGQFFWIDFGL